MRALNKDAARVMDILTDGLNEHTPHRKIDGANGFMAVVVEWIGYAQIGTDQGDLFSVAHYYEQNGDLMRDPEMIFYKAGAGSYFATYYRQDNLGIEQESVLWDEDGKIKGYYRREQSDQTSFANTWMRNMKHQQNLSEKVAA
jgi:hypothetical protein